MHLVSITNGLAVGVVVPFGFDGYQGLRATQLILLVDGDDAFLSDDSFYLFYLLDEACPQLVSFLPNARPVTDVSHLDME